MVQGIRFGTRDQRRVKDLLVTTGVPLSIERDIPSIALAIQEMTYQSTMLIPATLAELEEALVIDHEKGGFCDTGTFACGACLADGMNYRVWSDEALAWLKENASEFGLEQFVGPQEEQVNLCAGCAKAVSRALLELPGSEKAVPPPFDLFP